MLNAQSPFAPRMAPTPGCSFVARHAFAYGPRDFAAGAAFPYAELGLVEDQALELWRSAMLEVAPETPAVIEPPTSREPPTKRRR